jgi:carboxymethylenebutenolidase
MAGGAAAELLELTSADGTKFSASFAESPDSEGPAIVILPDIRGLYQFYIELAERFAQAGFHAISIDYFGRTAGLGPRDEDFEWMPHIMATKPEQIQADAAAAIEALKERTGASSFVTLGFCFGGTQSLLASTNRDLPLDAYVAFYGGLNGAPLGIPSPPDVADQMQGPILGLYGGDDPNIPEDMIKAFEAKLNDAGVENDITIYPGAPHSFFDRSFDEHADACEDAWRRVISFLGQVGVPA